MPPARAQKSRHKYSSIPVHKIPTWPTSLLFCTSYYPDMVHLTSEYIMCSLNRSFLGWLRPSVLGLLWSHHQGLLVKLSKVLPCWAVSVIELLFEQRRFRVHMGDISSSWRVQNNGLPQGYVLAPTLFNLYINDMPATTCRKFIYADDIDVHYPPGTHVWRSKHHHHCWHCQDQRILATAA